LRPNFAVLKLGVHPNQSNFCPRHGVPLFKVLVGGELPRVGMDSLASRYYEHPSVAWCKAYFDILNRLGVTQCDRQTDGQIDRQTDRQTRSYSIRFASLRCAAKNKLSSRPSAVEGPSSKSPICSIFSSYFNPDYSYNLQLT